MQIKSISASVVAFAFLLAGDVASAAEQNSANSTSADENFEAKTAAKAEVRSRDVADSAPQAESSIKTTKPTRTTSVRNTRPQTDGHKDARACLKAGSNEAIARCARKYH